jgi:hypothetical protein
MNLLISEILPVDIAVNHAIFWPDELDRFPELPPIELSPVDRDAIDWCEYTWPSQMTAWYEPRITALRYLFDGSQ